MDPFVAQLARLCKAHCTRNVRLRPDPRRRPHARRDFARFGELGPEKSQARTLSVEERSFLQGHRERRLGKSGQRRRGDFQRGPEGSWTVVRPTTISPEGVQLNLAPGQTFAKNQFVGGIEVTTVLDRNCGNQ